MMRCTAVLVAGISGAAAAVAPALEGDAALLQDALAWVTGLVGTPYGWWTGGAIPLGAPAWAAPGPPPPLDQVRAAGIFCAGLPNLMLRYVGGAVPCLDLHPPDPGCGQCCGGTGAYGRNFSAAAARPFDLGANYTRGTLLGRKYTGVHDQGHVAVLLGEGADAKILQSYSNCATEARGCTSVVPGVTANWTLRQATQQLFFARFTYAVAPEDWLLPAARAARAARGGERADAGPS